MGNQPDPLESMRSRAERVLVGGVSRGFNLLPDVGPIYFDSATGSEITDIRGDRYLDYVMGWGSLILGHDPPSIRSALLATLRGGFLAQYETELHVRLAEILCGCVPCAERVRFAASGLEATQYAIRLARAATGRERIIKCEGHFHGMNDQLLFSSGAPIGTRDRDGLIEPVPTSAGIPGVLRDLLVVVPYNDADAIVAAVRRHRGQVAAIILEPIALNNGCILPESGYLEAVRALADHEGIILIFDEILTGFRVALGGAQELLSVTPDLACFSKAFGCGLPIAALAGRLDIMQHLGPPGDVPMSGTHAGRILSVAGTLAGLDVLMQPGFYDHLKSLNHHFVVGLRDLFVQYGVPGFVQGIGGRIGAYFGLTSPPREVRDVATGWNSQYHRAFFHRLVTEQKVYGFVPLPFGPDALNLSTAHTDYVLDETLRRMGIVLAELPYREAPAQPNRP